MNDVTISLLTQTKLDMQCECDSYYHHNGNEPWIEPECQTATHFKYHLVSSWLDDSYWLCQECRECHFRPPTEAEIAQQSLG